MFQFQLVLETVLLSYSSTQLSCLKQKCIRRLDWQISCHKLEFQRKRKLSITMLELYHTSEDFKLLDLFSMNNETFAQAVGFFISISMVYVQLKK